MLEAKFVLPINTPEGRDLSTLHTKIEIELCQAFGGFHAETVRGGWLTPEGEYQIEPCIAYTIAMPEVNSCNVFLSQLARHYAHLAEQRAYYIRFAGGGVKIVPIAPAPDAKAADPIHALRSHHRWPTD